MRKSWDEYFIELAHGLSARATCPKRHVGAILVDRNNYIVSTGYNGSAPGEPHCIDVGCYEINGRCKRTIHAEDNALRRSTKMRRCGSKLYITDFPCLECTKKILKSGVVEVIYDRGLSRSINDMLALFEEDSIVVRRINSDPR